MVWGSVMLMVCVIGVYCLCYWFIYGKNDFCWFVGFFDWFVWWIWVFDLVCVLDCGCDVLWEVGLGCDVCVVCGVVDVVWEFGVWLGDVCVVGGVWYIDYGWFCGVVWSEGIDCVWSVVVVLVVFVVDVGGCWVVYLFDFVGDGVVGWVVWWDGWWWFVGIDVFVM